MWTTPPDTSIVCTPYACLIHRKNRKHVWADCKDCFDLNFREQDRWLKIPNALDFHIEEGHRADRGGPGRRHGDLRRANATIVTTSMNLDGPFNNFMASRGVVPIFLTVSHRLPFFDNTLDLVHSMHLLSAWIPHRLLDFILYDIYRVLRPGGVFWLDHFFCRESLFTEVYVPMIESLGYKRLLWHVGQKMDRGIQFKEVYLSALLEKPLSSN